MHSNSIIIDYILRLFLFPFAVVYNVITHIRNILYDANVLRSFAPTVATICVGNLRVGGTGKSPFVEYLIRQLISKNIPLCTLSRGYGRNTRGFLQAKKGSSSSDVGDESFQYFKKYGNSISVFVGEDRVTATKKITQIEPSTKVLILDDAFQHRSIKARANIILTEYNRPFYEDYVLPVGRLREARSGAKRADCIVVTKCPAYISQHKKVEVASKLQHYSKKSIPVFFTTISYSKPKRIIGEVVSPESIVDVLLIAGIDNPAPFIEYCEKSFNVLGAICFADHHIFTYKDIQNILKKTGEVNSSNCVILTTEKDSSRLVQYVDELKEISVFYLPIEIKFLSDEDKFQNLVEVWINA